MSATSCSSQNVIQSMLPKRCNLATTATFSARQLAIHHAASYLVLIWPTQYIKCLSLSSVPGTDEEPKFIACTNVIVDNSRSQE